eukprot:613291-Prymnesium_polylepis.1
MVRVQSRTRDTQAEDASGLAASRWSRGSFPSKLVPTHTHSGTQSHDRKKPEGRGRERGILRTRERRVHPGRLAASAHVEKPIAMDHASSSTTQSALGSGPRSAPVPSASS